MLELWELVEYHGQYLRADRLPWLLALDMVSAVLYMA